MDKEAKYELNKALMEQWEAGTVACKEAIIIGFKSVKLAAPNKLFTMDEVIEMVESLEIK